MGKEPVLIFMHLPKTAGHTLLSILTKQYGTQVVLPLYDSTFGEEIKEIPHAQIDEAAVILGHFYFGIHTILARPSIYITMLREPVERVISHYYYVQRDPSHYLHTAATEMSLSEYVIHCNLCEPNNDQTRLLAGRELATSMGTWSPEMLPIAKQNLRRHFAVAGIVEEFDRSLILLKRVLRWRIPYYVRKNVTQGRSSKRDISPETVSVIQAYNELDCELYRYTKELLQEQICLQGEQFEKEVRRFLRINRLFGRLNSLMPLPTVMGEVGNTVNW